MIGLWPDSEGVIKVIPGPHLSLTDWNLISIQHLQSILLNGLFSITGEADPMGSAKFFIFATVSCRRAGTTSLKGGNRQSMYLCVIKKSSMCRLSSGGADVDSTKEQCTLSVGKVMNITLSIPLPTSAAPSRMGRQRSWDTSTRWRWGLGPMIRTLECRHRWQELEDADKRANGLPWEPGKGVDERVEESTLGRTLFQKMWNTTERSERSWDFVELTQPTRAW
jgi:hypothetical protein